jgi:toxin ParE1/3/4
MAANRRLIWAPAAQRDLRGIWHYFSQVASPEIADRLLREIDRAARRLEQFPLSGRRRDGIAPHLRSVLVHPYVVFYRATETAVEIARVLHQRRNLAAILRKERGDDAQHE